MVEITAVNILNVLGLVLCFCAGLIVGLIRERDTKAELRSKEKTLKYYNEKYLRMQGWNIGRGEYDLRSFDGGKIWYAVKEDKETRAVTILGTAEEIFPGFMAEQEGMRALVRYAEEHGPISPLNMTAEASEILGKAGFSVKRA